MMRSLYHVRESGSRAHWSTMLPRPSLRIPAQLKICGCAVALVAVSAMPAVAATFMVTKVGDTGPGSLRQAILNANASVEPDEIHFNIPGAGVQTIKPKAPLPTITSPVTIDGYTQPGAEPNTRAAGNNAKLRIQLDGSDTPAGSIGLQITAGNSTVRGLVINNFPGTGIQLGEGTNGGNVIVGNFIGTNAAGTIARGNRNGIFLFSSPGNQIGGTSPAARNLISGNTAAAITTFVTSNNVIEGNYIGTDRAGRQVVSSGDANASGIELNAVCDNNRIGGTAAGARNVISGHQRIAIFMQGTVGNVVEGNYIGTDVTGEVALGNGLNQQAGCAVCINGNRNPFGTGGGPATDNRIGGTDPAAGNVIAGYQGGGAVIFLGGSSVGDSRRANSNVIQGNLIGTNQHGTVALGNRGIGIHVQDGDDNLIGGTELGAGNVIAHSRISQFTNAFGVRVSAGVRNRILGNSIYDNDELGIDLGFGATGVTPNDSNDTDTGPNDVQNFPVLTEVTISDVGVRMKGTLNSTPNTAFRLEFYGSAQADAAGYGEGQTLLGIANVNTGPAGNASFNVLFPVSAEVTSFTATATDAAGNTSEFSPAVRTRLLNISTRMRVLTGERILIGGFIIAGGDPKTVLLRGLGPSLTAGGISDPLLDPVLELHQAGVAPVTNDDWRDTQEQEIEDTGIPPGENVESAILVTLQPGVYTAQLREKNGQPGVGLVEVFDLTPLGGSVLANISTRGFVDTGDNVMIGGFIVGPARIRPTRILIRAIGPSLTDDGVGDALQDPVLKLFDVNGNEIDANDNWKDDQEDEIRGTGVPPEEDAEAALITTLNAGAYTAVVRGKGETAGVALVEIFDIQ